MCQFCPPSTPREPTPPAATQCEYGWTLRLSPEDYPCGNAGVITAVMGAVTRATNVPAGIVEVRVCFTHYRRMMHALETQPLTPIEYRG